jgi:hypothetical protein
MNELQKEFEATGYASWVDSDDFPEGKVPTQAYVKWLEERVRRAEAKKPRDLKEQVQPVNVDFLYRHPETWTHSAAPSTPFLAPNPDEARALSTDADARKGASTSGLTALRDAALRAGIAGAHTKHERP